jgi:hypothetical protein
MKDGFYLADETHKTISGGVVKLANLLYFRHAISGFDGKATKEHVKNYAVLFGEFKKSNQDYVLPESFVAEEVGAPSVVVVEKPVVEVPVES